MKKQQMNVRVFCSFERYISSISRNEIKDRFKKYNLEFFYEREKITSFEGFLNHYETYKDDFVICICLGEKNLSWEKDILLLKSIIIIYQPVLSTYAKNHFVTHSFFESCKWFKRWHRNVKLRSKEVRYLQGVSRR